MRRYLTRGQVRQQAHLRRHRGQSHALGSQRLRLLLLLLLLLLLPRRQWRCGRSIRPFWCSLCWCCCRCHGCLILLELLEARGVRQPSYCSLLRQLLH